MQRKSHGRAPFGNENLLREPIFTFIHLKIKAFVADK
jgi:hypothetical protein